MTSRHSPKLAAADSVKNDWNSVATFGALNSNKSPRSPLRSPTICRSDPMECTSPHFSADGKGDSEGRGSPIPPHLTLDRKARVSDRSSCEAVHEGSTANSMHSSGFLTPPSRNSSPSHSDHVGARARLPPPMETPPGTPGRKNVGETVSNWHWLQYPKLRLSDYQLKSYLWLPVTKNDPRPTHVESRSGSRRPSSFAGNMLKHRNKSVSFNFGDVKQSIDRIRSMPATPSISRRWSSTGLDQAVTRGGSMAESYSVPERRKTIPFTDRGTEALTAIKERLTRRDIYAHQMETPTIITLRRASAVLGTVAQRQSSMTGNPTPSLPDKWEQACNDVPLAAYLITSDEIHTLAAFIRRTFADGTPKESTRALDTVDEDDQKPKKKPRSGSFVNRGRVIPERKFPANVAITVADVHSLSRSSTMSRKGSFMSQMSRKTSIVSTMLARKSVHEIIWEDDGTPQSLRSSTWNLSHDPLKNNVATWSSNSFRRESGQSGISIEAKLASPASSGAESPGKKSPKPPTFKPVFNDKLKHKARLESKYSHPPHWKKGSIHELPFPGVLPQADGGAMPVSMPIPIDDVVSFPPLPQRQHTSEWQIPPTDINTPVQTPAEEIPNIFLRHPSAAHSLQIFLEGEEESEEDENKLYRYGIDATIAPKVSRISVTAPTTPTPMIKTTLWGSDEPIKYGPHQQRRRSSAMPQPNILKKQLSNGKMGASLGASSGARRRSSTRADHIRIVTAQVEREEGRAPWRKARKDSGYPGLAGLAPPSSDEGSDMSGGSGGEEETGATERTTLLLKGKEKMKAKTGMVLQLPTTIRKMKSGAAKGGMKRVAANRVTEENEDEIEAERRVWMTEKARSPSPTRNIPNYKPRRPVTPKLGCGRADCTRSSCGNNHSRPSTPGISRPTSSLGSRPASPAKKNSSDGSVFSLERTKTGTYVWGSGKADEPVQKSKP